MKQLKSLLAVCSCAILLLAGCRDEEQNASRAPADRAEGKEETLSGSAKDAGIPYEQELLNYVSVQEGYQISDYGEYEGTEYSWAVFNMRQEDEQGENISLYWEIAVLQEGSVIQVLEVEDGEHGAAFPAAADMVTETDVNFDGKQDILIGLGHFGNQGAVVYKCFLGGESGLIYCPSFSEIANPSLDHTAQVVRSQWRNSASSHGWGIFKFTGTEFVETQRLTETAEYRNEGEEPVRSWTEEVFLEGEWQVREYYTEEDYDAGTIYNKLYGPESYWGLDQAKWNTSLNSNR